ncbi:MAG TPA: GLPGLI family protein [Sediminibacterium sp.]|uniref:GLPGLI family protein n=1 Tax=Sediminibacterium sp. TaxID=1917865 RepID=UPI0008CB6F58|nr:GLPGLI family protein [Sediminibacterium sp.]OHC84167.1 MAG: hypothetical protein A2472_14785 [Sphingobacteriia bacterium RIFOXYC2_FULL_35_18]OHC88024.1 MAG: hypothetical protein A2546_14175 [Sphingobacteriia bacterium RIFOXYD2_FULL_35_12]HLD53775.1 GLPGLI family protein [Sediminibacterium sp.]
MQKLYCLTLFVVSLNIGLSQTAPLFKNGIITFERKVNLFANKNLSSEYKIQNNQFRTTYYQLHFTKNITSFIPSINNLQLDRVGIQPAENNRVYMDQKTKSYQSIKKIFDEQYVIEDSLPKISWKITNEKRIIAGFECRRANALIFDSVYIVAFYSDDIPISSGPELFNGLPGMILGLSLPHLHINIFATKVVNQEVNETTLVKIKSPESPISALVLKNRLLKSATFQGEDAFSFLIQSLL